MPAVNDEQQTANTIKTKTNNRHVLNTNATTTTLHRHCLDVPAKSSRRRLLPINGAASHLTGTRTAHRPLLPSPPGNIQVGLTTSRNGMQPLNPFLAAFFKSSVVAQCTPVHHHILLVPITEVLLTHREVDSGTSVADFVSSDDFLTSHVLRIPTPASAAAAAKEKAKDKDKDKDKDPAASQSLRDARGKPKQFTTLNGRNVIIKDSFVYSNKGFKTLAQAQLLYDATWYPDVFEPRQWLIYYISRPLVGSWEEVKISPALLIPGAAAKAKAADERLRAAESSWSNEVIPLKKDIGSFHDLLNHFPMIARQMHPGLEKLFVEFTAVLDKPLPPPPSAMSIPDPHPEGPITVATKRARSNSYGSRGGRDSPDSLPVTDNFYAEDDEDVMRASLESAVTAAIDLFQAVDKQQLSLLGATTDLTGPLVEKLIERYVTENVHDMLFPKLCALKRPEDGELESRIRQMSHVDISQLGISIDGGVRAKHNLLIQLGPVIEEFNKMSIARSPGDMLDTLLSTIKAVSQLTAMSEAGEDRGAGHDTGSEKAVAMTVNADTLVSLLLYVIIRSQVRSLQARLSYVRNFIFVDDVDCGEMGYALSTFEAVLAYLALDSAGLRRASRRNKALWEAATKGKVEEVKSIMEPHACAVEEGDEGRGPDDDDDGYPEEDEEGRGRAMINFGEEQDVPLGPLRSSMRPSLIRWSTSRSRGSPRRSMSSAFSHGSGLSHVFPFQSSGEAGPAKRVKRVAMDTRSMSSVSELSFHSRTASSGTMGSGLEADISVERLALTKDAHGQSVLMMAVQSEQSDVVRYLLSLEEYYPLAAVLDDMNNEDTTLLSAAMQLGNAALVDVIVSHVEAQATPWQLRRYLADQDIWGRSAGHYLFHTPQLMGRIGRLMSWRQRDKNGQTPLFALCRCYDHADYYAMVDMGLRVAHEAQGDGLGLHLDEHVDAKGNTLLHIMTDARLAALMLQWCDADVNATNDRRFTALMVASKYGRYDMVRCLFADARVDTAARELRGLTAAELAKDDEVRNRIDDLGLFAMAPARDGRITGVVRAFLVDDGSVRLVVKSAAPTHHGSYTLTTSRRSLADFERLARLLAQEHPASWIPPVADTRSPFQLAAKPSRAVLRETQARTDAFLRIMLAHPTLATHEALWEFLLVPELQLDAMEERSRLKVEARVDKVRDDLSIMLATWSAASASR
ncbi:hypothetical protein CDD82_524 [Ophiocordyceps australis]|uniref:VPS9 domain-containing protein n=1 Tax=Ophiocordyceps australis TaxID=1399860 RepID=A0A2C5YLW3_9HYPO|nr:hypothetical protein CDD82_524 [Ophiocordyceps australis]